MSAFPSPPSAAGDDEAREARRRRAAEREKAFKRQPNWNVIAPLFYAPVVPLMRIGLRGRVPQQTLDRLTGGALLVMLSHAGYMMVAGDDN